MPTHYSRDFLAKVQHLDDCQDNIFAQAAAKKVAEQQLLLLHHKKFRAESFKNEQDKNIVFVKAAEDNPVVFEKNRQEIVFNNNPTLASFDRKNKPSSTHQPKLLTYKPGKANPPTAAAA